MIFKTTKKVVSRIFLQITLFLFSSFMVATRANAVPPMPPLPPSAYSPIRVSIVDDRGRSFRQIQTSSRAYRVRRAYVQAKRGKRYSLRLRNMSNRRVGVVIAVDGRNILTGKKSWLGKHEKMYILNPYETSVYKGWRTAKNRVNRFFFTSAGNSYANAWHDKSAMGVIAIAVYNEKPRIAYRRRQNNSFDRDEARSSLAPSAAPMAKMRRADETGTGFGREEYSPTVKVHFKPQNRAIVKHFYKYEWRSTLCKRGVIKCYNHPKKPHNRFWPTEEYAPYPPGRERNDYRHNQYNKHQQDSRNHNPVLDY